MSTDNHPNDDSLKRPLIHVGRPNIGDVEALVARVRAMCERRWLSNDGQLVQEFEQRVAQIANVKHCVAMCNATVALEIAIRATSLSGEVIVPSYTFVATAHALQWQEITPVFCDIDPLTHNLDPAKVEQLITPRTTGIIGVHIWGRGCDTAALADITKRRGLKLMFDASHAFGCTHQGRPIGSFGLAEVFSFHATKFINCAEGGAVVTNDDELAAKMRLMRNFGFSGYDRVIYIGTNGKMNELSAAMGLTSLDSLEHFVDVNRRNYEAYKTQLQGIPGIRLLEHPDAERSNFQYVVLDVDESVCGLTRDQIVQVLHLNNILARRYFFPGVHRMEPYRSYYPNTHLMLPVTEQVVQRVIVLPTGTAVDRDDIIRIAQILRSVVADRDSHAKNLPRSIPPGGSFRESLE